MTEGVRKEVRDTYEIIKRAGDLLGVEVAPHMVIDNTFAILILELTERVKEIESG